MEKYKSLGFKSLWCIDCDTKVKLEMFLIKDGSNNKSYNKIIEGCNCGQFGIKEDE